MARVMTSGMVKTIKMEQWVIRSQVLNIEIYMNAVHRLNGGGVIEYIILRYSQAHVKACSKSKEESTFQVLERKNILSG